MAVPVNITSYCVLWNQNNFSPLFNVLLFCFSIIQMNSNATQQLWMHWSVLRAYTDTHTLQGRWDRMDVCRLCLLDTSQNSFQWRVTVKRVTLGSEFCTSANHYSLQGWHISSQGPLGKHLHSHSMFIKSYLFEY